MRSICTSRTQFAASSEAPRIQLTRNPRTPFLGHSQNASSPAHKGQRRCVNHLRYHVFVAPALTQAPSPGCEEVMNALEECHARGFLYKALGNCNQAKAEVSKCLKVERLERQKANREQGRAKRERVEQAWREMDKAQ